MDKHLNLFRCSQHFKEPCVSLCFIPLDLTGLAGFTLNWKKKNSMRSKIGCSSGTSWIISSLSGVRPSLLACGPSAKTNSHHVWRSRRGSGEPECLSHMSAPYGLVLSNRNVTGATDGSQICHVEFSYAHIWTVKLNKPAQLMVTMYSSDCNILTWSSFRSVINITVVYMHLNSFAQKPIYFTPAAHFNLD